MPILPMGEVFKMKHQAAVSIFIIATVTACAPSDDPSADWIGTIDTLASGTVVISNPAPGLWPDSGGWRVVEDLRIGALDGDGPDVFGTIKDFAVDDKGAIHIVDVQALEIRVFDRDGRHRYTMGGPGRGPGEFRNIWGITLAPDGKLWVLDNRLARWSIFDRTGAFDRTYHRPMRARNYLWPGGFDAEGKLWEYMPGRGAPTLHRLDVGLRGPPSAESDAGNRMDVGGNTEQNWVDTRIAAFDTLGTTTVVEHQAAFLEFERRGLGASMQMPFASRRPWVMDPRGYIWFAVTDTYRIYQTTFEGDTVRVIDRDLPPVPLGAAARDSISVIVAQYRENGYQPVDLDEKTFPEFRPYFENITVDDKGGVWMWHDSDSVSTTYEVFDPDGRYLGEVHVPFPIQRFFNPLIRGDEFFAVTRDEFDVSYLVRGKIERD